MAEAARADAEPPWSAWPPALVVVDLPPGPVVGPRLPSWWPAVVVGIAADPDQHAHPTCDLVLGSRDDLAPVAACAGSHPLAATALAGLLRAVDERSVEEGLLAESAVYSTLQGGPEVAAWRLANPPRSRRDDDHERVVVARHGDELHVTLARPAVRNALDARMRDELVAALGLVAVDDSIVAVHLRGEGKAFCAGGDLDEFGSRPDPVTAHLVRQLQSPARALHRIADRVTVEVHGACRGSGVELPAFAGRVVAAHDATFGLPEVSLGLIPGAGGTVSVARRIGRHRTLWLALSGEAIDAPTALAWGLVDDPSP